MNRVKQLFNKQEKSKPNQVSPLAREGWHATHQHRKGGLYRLLCYGTNEADRSAVAIYDDAVGTVWVRAQDEFDDGRFTPLNQAED